MTKFESKPLTEATPEEVRAFATHFLGIPVDENDSDNQILAKVAAAHEGENIFVQRVAEQNEGQSGTAPIPVATGDNATEAGLVGSLGRNDPRVTLTVHAEERDGVVSNRHKEVGVNGVVWLLRRGEPVTVPFRVFEALQNATRHIITHDSEGETREQVVHAVPFSVHRMPSDEEIAAYHADTDHRFVP